MLHRLCNYITVVYPSVRWKRTVYLDDASVVKEWQSFGIDGPSESCVWGGYPLRQIMTYVLRVRD